MIKRRWWLTGGVAASIIILCVGVLIWRTWLQTSPALTVEEVNQRVLAEYPGEITRLIQQGNTYSIRLQSEQGIYDMVLGAQNGDIQSIKRVDSASSANNTSTSQHSTGTAATDKNNNNHNNPSSSSPNPEPSDQQQNPSTSSSAVSSDHHSSGNEPNPADTSQSNQSSQSGNVSPSGVISAEKAEQIALRQVQGTVDDTDYEHGDKQGQRYYLVEIDTADDREATVQINAISGEVMSVTWDDADEPES
ncbi:PepSY domain-containing protein [Paenibacillus bovis]|uniref:PepSY domain-containing protein n=1 Tax=Paenibacillus bovis TaxID=1616788 RepID=A0A172ZI35_9BACL|nr:PepSY domain-containing protein [Paenibacillus bovis]ANF96810.1 hypothetical protein AR543_12850 [Paenibacillus bovis]